MRRAALLAFVCTSSCSTAPAPVDARPPNVILIMADDVGVEAFGCYGGESYATQHLDRLAADGMLFSRCFSQPLCTPSRVKIMTGRGNLRNYVGFSLLAPRERTFAHLAQEAGYATCVVGKWQLLGAEHYGEQAGQGTGPREAGFDRWCLWQVGELGSRYADPTMEVDGVVRSEIPGAFGPDVSCDFLLDFVEEHRDRPFFAYFPMALVHDPFVRTPLSPPGERTRQERFGDMMRSMDAIVGRIVRRLDELDLRDDTLLLFTSDNGTGRKITSRAWGRDVTGGKGRSTDAGTHVPLLASWPGRIAPGTECGDLVDLSDFLPTIADAIGADWPEDRVLDGLSFHPQLVGRPGSPRETITIYSNPRPDKPGRNPRVRFARDHRHKLYDDGRFFDCVDDPGEEAPLAWAPDTSLREIRARLQRALDAMPEEPAHLR